MPIYEYQCESCNHQLEALQKINDAPLQRCPECHQSMLKKLVSAAGFRLKGGGWYETDFKSGAKKNVVDSSSGDKKKSTSESNSTSKSSTKASATKSSTNN